MPVVDCQAPVVPRRHCWPAAIFMVSFVKLATGAAGVAGRAGKFVFADGAEARWLPEARVWTDTVVAAVPAAGIWAVIDWFAAA